ncbi:hypothetical protein C4J81_12970 [Deltaproteobacteria bacterium Smac51]|nr:hypothetical protein C4J81_12970 [Deltaproteobacteria bacterium Smac51]
MKCDRNGIPILPDSDQHHQRSKDRYRYNRKPYEFTDGTKKKAFAKYGGLCQWCGRSISRWDKGEYHHLTLISHGGGRALGNCLLLHPRCHRDKEVYAFLHGWGLEP